MELKNRIFIMRHGHSRANEQGLILSHPDQGVLEAWGLSETGKIQALEAAEKFRPGPALRVITSDFARAAQTAKIVCKCLGLQLSAVDKRLRERFFGDLDRTDQSNYSKIWERDVLDDDQEDFACESPNQVLDRVLSLVRELESRFAGEEILLVSHGDTLQILQTAFAGIRPGLHRSLPHLDTARIKEL